MAFVPSESPSIQIKEIDLSGVVPAVTTSTGAFVGSFNWGPVHEPILVGNEAELVSNFGSPSLDVSANTQDFLAAAAFLKYSSSAYITRTVDSADTNAVAAGTAPLVKNLDDFNGQTLTSNKVIAKYPGTVGNSLKVSICPTGALADSAFDNWTYKSSFDAAPGTSSHVAELSGNASAGDEVHIAIVDEDGVLTGTKGSVLETFPYVSLATDAKTADGTSNYILDVLNDRSSYVWGASVSADFTGVTTSAAFDSAGNHSVTDYSLASGTASAIGVADYQTGFDQYTDEDTIQVDFLVAPGLTSAQGNTTIVNYLAGIAAARKDCVVVASPNRDEVVGVNNTATIVSSAVSWANGLNSTSYLIVDNNYVKIYDKYNDEYTYIPAAPMTAGIMAATDDVAAPWFSPAGNRRGQYFGVTSLAYNATKAQRDTLYKAGVNPIVNLPGQGILLYGDKTHLGRPSAFDRINVRRLFLGIERAIKAAAQNVMFEFNDEFTRAEFVNIVEPFLREIKGRRGITDFRVVCDETNNTSAVVDSNRFVASIFIKPARSINYVTLNFVAVRTGVDFEEVVGLA